MCAGGDSWARSISRGWSSDGNGFFGCAGRACAAIIAQYLRWAAGVRVCAWIYIYVCVCDCDVYFSVARRDWTPFIEKYLRRAAGVCVCVCVCVCLCVFVVLVCACASARYLSLLLFRNDVHTPQADLGPERFRVPNHGCLEQWARQGVFLVCDMFGIRTHAAYKHTSIQTHKHTNTHTHQILMHTLKQTKTSKKYHTLTLAICAGVSVHYINIL